ncbi:mycothiol synthase [Rhodococcus sp. X156]|uniref:mycothiol synthase n=1 Tax=Rhodococcus sp. X156 TaxID=2499145 RepID=UPI000FDA074F|nr:mycothiol synthase [Rhodococcus sp. X156]
MQVCDTLEDAQRHAVGELLQAAHQADGVAAVSEQVVLAVAADSSGPHLLATRGGELAGYAHLSAASAEEANPMAELAVHPRHRRRGVGTALALDLLDRAGESLRVWAHGNLPAAQALARQLQLTSRRELWQMRVDLAGAELPAVRLPEGVRLRTYVPERDDAEVLRVNNAAFSWHPEQGGWGPADLAARRAEPWFDPNGFFLAVDADDRVLGFHWTKVHPAEGDEPALGEVYVVGVDPAAQGGGLGRSLTIAGLEHLRSRGLSTVLLYVEADNAAAVHTYTKLGFSQFHVDVAYGR